ncbi:MAG: MBL fold metallo-hydrolase, partial [Chloroflexi bacterium]|nr:MBL fold metallo-hydrolase [Chloroflexota bacterium]
MRVDFVGHASLLVRRGALTLLSDPWWTGGAFGDQWYPYPFPVPERYPLQDLDGLYISHGHEDHLHPGTLKALAPHNRRTRVLIPRRYDPGMRSYI